MIPTIIPTAYKAKTTASRGCVSSQATSSARLRPTGHFRIVARILDLHTDGSRALHTDGNRAADDLTKCGDRSGTYAKCRLALNFSAFGGKTGSDGAWSE
jgi:hypothetical protein